MSNFPKFLNKKLIENSDDRKYSNKYSEESKIFIEYFLMKTLNWEMKDFIFDDFIDKKKHNLYIRISNIMLKTTNQIYFRRVKINFTSF